MSTVFDNYWQKGVGELFARVFHHFGAEEPVLQANISENCIVVMTTVRERKEEARGATGEGVDSAWSLLQLGATNNSTGRDSLSADCDRNDSSGASALC